MDSFTPIIYKWYKQNKRDLPWRGTTDPYKIWISEIILQQTRIAQGLSYYNRFIGMFPTVTDLANADEDSILKTWQGLGYYTRARNVHFTAKEIVHKYNGVFPGDIKTILSLKGIGEYTAAAIASIAFDLPLAAVDGNIYRLLSRYFGISTPIDTAKGKTEIHEIATGLLPSGNYGFHNEALMEFGALQCAPKSPNCQNCPLISSCYAANHNISGKIPVKSKKVKKTARYFYYFFVESENKILLEKRTENDIWKNLYQFPMIESQNELSDAEILNIDLSFIAMENLVFKSVGEKKKHVLSHQTIYARCISLETGHPEFNHSKFIQINKKDIYKFAVPKLLERFYINLNLPEK